MSGDERRGGGWVVLAFILLVGGMLSGWHLLTEPTDAGGASAYSCRLQTIRAGETLPATLVTVDVYNGGDEEGLAGRVSGALQARGFRPGAIANNLSATKPETVTILTTRKADPKVQLVARQFDRVEFEAPDVALGSGVTVLVGDRFTSLKVDAPTSIRATSNTSVCF